MARTVTWLAAVFCIASFASAQTVVHGVLGNGDVIRINPVTGAGTLFGHSGAQVTTGTSVVRQEGGPETSWVEVFPFVVGDGVPQATVTWVSPCTGQTASFAGWTIQPPGSHVRAISGEGGYLVEETPLGEMLAQLDLSYLESFSLIGPTGRGDLVAAAKYGSGPLYALGTDNGGALYTLDTGTGAATLVGPCAFGDARSLAFLPDGTLLACGGNLLRIDPATGGVTAVGPTGFSDVRALAVTPGCVPPQSSCYPNCDGICNPPPCPNILDLGCFLNKFAAGDPYANCDGSTSPPFLNINDFICFLNRFAAGCP